MKDDPKDATVNVLQLVELWRQGDQEAATRLYDRYQSRLLLLVNGRLNDRLRRRLDPEELVQSIMKSAFRVTSEQDIGCRDETGFWKWLVSVALNKTYKRIDRETAGKRDPKRETGGDTVLGERILGEPTPDDVVEVSELLEKIMAKLTDVQGKILLGKLNGLSHAEIAEKLDVSTKTVQRNGQAIRDAAVEILGTNVPAWLVDEVPSMSEQFAACMKQPVSKWLPKDSGGNGPVVKLSLADVFNQGEPAENLLDGIRSIAKQRGSAQDHDTPQMICAAIYLLAIATARLKLDRRLSSDEDHKLRARVESILKEPWLGKQTIAIFQSFLGVIA